MSELAGLSFSALQQVFRKGDIQLAFALEPLTVPLDTIVFVGVDPGAGGPQSDYAIVSIVRVRGTIQVCHLSQKPRLLARVHKVLHALPLVGEKVVRKALVQVVVESHEPAVVARDLHIDNFLL